MCLDLFSEETPLWFNSCKRPPPVSDRLVFAFWVVAYGRFDCSYMLQIFLYKSEKKYEFQKREKKPTLEKTPHPKSPQSRHKCRWMDKLGIDSKFLKEWA